MGEARRRRQAGLPVQTSAATAPDVLLDQARALQQRGAGDQALPLLWQLLQQAPGHAEAQQLCGRLLVDLGQPTLGLSHLQRAVALAPQRLDWRINLARLQLALGQPAEARQQLQAVVDQQPGHATAQFQLGGLCEAQGDAAAAASAFLAAAQVDPGHALAHLGAAGQLYKLNRLDEAVAAQQRALALAPGLAVDGVMGLARSQSAAPDLQARAARSAALCRPGPAAATPDALRQAVAACELLVVDDFLPDALACRTRAQSLHFLDASAHPNGNFPGRQTVGGQADAALLQRIADALGRDLKWHWPGHGAFRISAAGSLARSDIHVDHGDSRVAYAGVLYLSLPADCQGGTSFWRHRETGWARSPTPAQAAASPYGSLAGFMRAQAAGDARGFDQLAQGRGQWDLLFEVPMHFNRLIVYRSDYFHGISQVFGSGLGDGRLTQLFFFEPLDTPG
jgi:tetratricopeptide (TPR) repeat protein